MKNYLTITPEEMLTLQPDNVVAIERNMLIPDQCNLLAGTDSNEVMTIGVIFLG